MAHILHPPRHQRRAFLPAAATVALAATLLAGCSGTVEEQLEGVLPDREPLYRSSKRLPPLEVPPDLSRARLDDRLPVPALQPQDNTLLGSRNTGNQSDGRAQRVALGGANASQTDQPVAASTPLLPSAEGVEMRRSGGQRWLVVDASAEEVWNEVKEYFVSEGLAIASEEPLAGIIETDWAVERSAMTSGFLGSLVAKVNTTVFGPATRDRFRARLERGQVPGTTEVYISHRGAEEVAVTDTTTGRSTEEAAEYKVWQPRPSDPEIEAAVLRRLMVFIGVDPEQARTLVAGTGPDAPLNDVRARIIENDRGEPMLVVDDGYDRAWRRTGLALDRVGFTVEDRDRDTGRYFVRYVDPEIDTNNRRKSGLLSGLAFWRDNDPPPAPEYQVALADQGPRSVVMVLDTDGAPEKSATADRILGLLEEQLR